jgi:hypothetical protein
MSSEDKHKKKKAKKKLPEHLEVQRQNVICGAEMNFHVSRQQQQGVAHALSAAVKVPDRPAHSHLVGHTNSTARRMYSMKWPNLQQVAAAVYCSSRPPALHQPANPSSATCRPPLPQPLPASMQTSTSTSANMYAPMGVDNSWSFREFVDNMQIKVNRLTKESMEFELIGVDPAIANALRRILIAEVPTIAIEHVFIINNTSVIQVRPGAGAAARVPTHTRRSCATAGRVAWITHTGRQHVLGMAP